MGKFKPSMLGDIHALRVIRQSQYIAITKGRIIGSIDLSGADLSGNDLSGNPQPIFSYTYIIYGIFVEGEAPNWYWCDENAQVESPPVLAEAYDGTTALRDGLAVVVSGTFYQ